MLVSDDQRTFWDTYSRIPHLYAQPFTLHTQCAKGSYTKVVQQKMKIMAGRRRPRSAAAPRSTAGTRQAKHLDEKVVSRICRIIDSKGAIHLIHGEDNLWQLGVTFRNRSFENPSKANIPIGEVLFSLTVDILYYIRTHRPSPKKDPPDSLNTKLYPMSHHWTETMESETKERYSRERAFLRRAKPE